MISRRKAGGNRATRLTNIGPISLAAAAAAAAAATATQWPLAANSCLPHLVVAKTATVPEIQFRPAINSQSLATGILPGIEIISVIRACQHFYHHKSNKLARCPRIYLKSSTRDRRISRRAVPITSTSRPISRVISSTNILRF